MRGRVTNNTNWSTDDLRKLCIRVGQDEDLTEKKVRSLRITFNYTNSHTGDSGGHAMLGGKEMTITLNREAHDMQDLAHTIRHEMRHLRGFDHTDMHDDPRWMKWHKNDDGSWKRDENNRAIENDWRSHYVWALEPQWEIKRVVCAKPTAIEIADKREKTRLKKLAYAEAMAKRTSTRIKRLQTALKKWSTKVKRLSVIAKPTKF